MKLFSKRWLLGAASVAVIATAALVGGQAVDGSGGQALAGPKKASGSATGLGRLTGVLPRDHLTLESAIKVDLSRETVRLPLYEGKADGETVWYVLLDASDAGLAHDLGVNYAPKLANPRPPRPPASSRSRGSICRSSRASMPGARSSTSAPTPASPDRGARALDLRARARQGVIQRRR